MPKQIAHYKQYHSVANFSADGTRAISLMNEKSKNSRFLGVVVVWEAATGREIKRYNNKDKAEVMALSPDSHHALIVERQEAIREGMLGMDSEEFVVKTTIALWDIEQDRTKTHTLPEQIGLRGGIIDALWLDNIYCLMLCSDKLMLWDISFENNAESITTFQIDGGEGSYLLYDGETIILCQGRDTLFFIKPHTWEMTRDKEILQQLLYAYPRPEPAPCIALSPNKQNFAFFVQYPGQYSKKILVIKPLNSTTITPTPESNKNVTAFAWSPDSTKLLYTEVDGKEVPDKTRKNRVWIWDIGTGEKTLFAELDYDVEHTYGANQDQKAWVTREIHGLQWHEDLIYIQYGNEILVWQL